jgi:DDE_Tnp_1-associated/Transposase DDE domain
MLILGAKLCSKIGFELASKLNNNKGFWRGLSLPVNETDLLTDKFNTGAIAFQFGDQVADGVHKSINYSWFDRVPGRAQRQPSTRPIFSDFTPSASFALRRVAPLLAVLAGAEALTDIARFGEKKLELLRRFLPFKNGAPAHDHPGDIFATLDARAFQTCFVAWVAARTNTRRSYQKKGSKEAIHMVSAFAARQRIVLGQVKVNQQSNEIVAIPALLDMMSIEGAVVTIDAMGCQRDIASKIIARRPITSLR